MWCIFTNIVTVNVDVYFHQYCYSKCGCGVIQKPLCQNREMHINCNLQMAMNKEESNVL